MKLNLDDLIITHVYQKSYTKMTKGLQKVQFGKIIGENTIGRVYNNDKRETFGDERNEIVQKTRWRGGNFGNGA